MRAQRRGRLLQVRGADNAQPDATDDLSDDAQPRNAATGAGAGCAAGDKLAARLPLDRLPGLEAVAASLRRRVVLPVRSPETLLKWGVRPSRGVLLYGPSGCGKSALAHAAALESGANVLSVQAASLLGPVVGESEAAVRALFAKARAAAPCVLILDQLEALAPIRGADTSSEQTLDRTLSTLPSEMDNPNNILVTSRTIMSKNTRTVKSSTQSINQLIKQKQKNQHAPL
ncbi:P-loop containing nucleoside triphosphate hydrolase protein [Pavlovales sp. CCMP2436]|nr:P-loop containing nucleoside triphosphate hydrolase protein [Pavlovales sp. CCMP2436]